MPKKRDIKVFLLDIINEINKLYTFTEDINSVNDFKKNEVVYYAVLKALENIGEAVKHIPDDMRINNAVEWKKIAGLRDVIIHEYFGLDEEIIWDVVVNKIPELKTSVEELLG